MSIKRYITALVVVMAIALSGGCSRKVTLSDKELAQIFHDAFLANAYTSKEGIRLDSLKLYEPIFQRYGYTTEDVQHSIGSFSTRKSARLSDVVERAITMLEAEGKILDREVAILDTINNIAKRRATRVIHSDSLITFNSLADSTKMTFTIEDPTPGRYTVSFTYFIDSLDKGRKSYRSDAWLERIKIDTVKNNTSITTYKKSNTQLRRNDIVSHSSNIDADEVAERIVMRFMTIEDEKGATHHARLKDLTVTNIPNNEEALEIIYRENLRIKIFDDDLLYITPEDRL